MDTKDKWKKNWKMIGMDLGNMPPQQEKQVDHLYCINMIPNTLPQLTLSFANIKTTTVTNNKVNDTFCSTAAKITRFVKLTIGQFDVFGGLTNLQ